jgi:hypothetical protein
VIAEVRALVQQGKKMDAIIKYRREAARRIR